jgi:serine/threonine-protein kinase HipA
MPVDIKPRILTTAINEDDGTASLDLAMNVADYFELEKDQAKAITADVGKAVSTWRDEAAQHGIAKGEINRMASAFEHDDLKKALGK